MSDFIAFAALTAWIITLCEAWWRVRCWLGLRALDRQHVANTLLQRKVNQRNQRIQTMVDQRDETLREAETPHSIIQRNQDSGK
jgi:hypothetical protein